MILVKSPTELTTSVTDLFLAMECLFIMAVLSRAPVADGWRASLWHWFFGLLAISSFIGALAHGWAISASLRNALFLPIFSGLGVGVALLAVGALLDWQGREMGQRFLWFIVAGSVLSFALGQLFQRGLIVFAIYEALAILFALAVYSFLAVTHRLEGAGFIALSILLSLAAAGVQASRFSIKILVPFDHNGIFHLIEMIALIILAWGVRIGLKP